MAPAKTTVVKVEKTAKGGAKGVTKVKKAKTKKKGVAKAAVEVADRLSELLKAKRKKSLQLAAMSAEAKVLRKAERKGYTAKKLSKKTKRAIKKRVAERKIAWECLRRHNAGESSDEGEACDKCGGDGCKECACYSDESGFDELPSDRDYK